MNKIQKAIKNRAFICQTSSSLSGSKSIILQLIVYFQKGLTDMHKDIFTIPDIAKLVKPVVKKYGVEKLYLFGSYARGEAHAGSDLDFLVFGGEGFKLTTIFAFSEELREVLEKDVDVFEINEINRDSDFYRALMKERLLIA